MIAITAIVIAVVAVMHGQEWVTQMKNLRGRWVAAKAQRMIDEGRHEAAVAVMLDAFERSPDEPVVVRTLAIAAAGKHPEQAKYLFERLDRLEAATPDDHTRLAKVLSLLNDKSGADALLRKTSSARSADIGFWRTRGELDASAGRVRESQAAYEKALTLSPDDADAAIGLGTLLASSSDPARVAQGVDILLAELQRAVEGRRSKSGNRALESLSYLPIPYTSQRVRLARIIEQMPVKTLGQSVLASIMNRPLILSDEQKIQRADEIRSVIYGHRALSIEAKEEAVATLQAHGEHGIVLEWLSSRHGDTGPRLYAQRIDSLMATGRWREAADMAGRAESPLGDATRKLLLALIHLRQSGGSAPDAEPLLTEALARASEEGRQSTFVAIGDVAREYGLHKIAFVALGHALECPFSQHLPLDDYVLSARRAHVSAAAVLHALSMRALIDRWNLDLQKHLCYLRLLLGTDIERAANDVSFLSNVLPEDPYIHFLSALASYRLCDFEGAADKLVPLPAHRWHQGEAAVIAAILTSAGRIDQADKLLGCINGTGMFAEESRLLSAPRTLASIMPGPRLRTVDPGGIRYVDDKR